MEHEQSAAAATQDGEAFSSGGFTEVRPAAGRARCRRPARSLARRARPRMLWPCFVTRLRSQRFVLRCHPDLGGRGHGEKLRAGRACGAARICVRGAVARATPCAGARRASGQPGGGFERSSSLRACRPAAISVGAPTHKLWEEPWERQRCGARCHGAGPAGLGGLRRASAARPRVRACPGPTQASHSAESFAGDATLMRTVGRCPAPEGTAARGSSAAVPHLTCAALVCCRSLGQRRSNSRRCLHGRPTSGTWSSNTTRPTAATFLRALPRISGADTAKNVRSIGPALPRPA